MDHELKQRLIGAVVVTALAAIFIPMLFDDPVDTSGKEVKELSIPTPTEVVSETSKNLPANKAQVLNRQDIELEAKEIGEDGLPNPAGEVSIAEVQNNEITNKNSLEHPATDSSVTNTEIEGGDEEGFGPTDQVKKLEIATSDMKSQALPEDTLDNQSAKPETIKKPQQNSESTTKSAVTKPEVVEKIKAKTVTSEKSQAADKDHKDKAKQPNTKLVRYSIQAGSFTKKENAQSLVDKLRKQGMPATIVAKGDLFRVKIGPSLDKEKAKEMKAKLDKQNIKGLLTSE